MIIIPDDDLIAFDINDSNRKYLIEITNEEWSDIIFDFLHKYGSPAGLKAYSVWYWKFAPYLCELIELKQCK